MSDQIAKRLKALIDYVRDCQIRVGKGEIMELQGLDKNVVDICEAIAKLDADEARDMEDQMTLLIDSLEELARAMKEQQGKLPGGGK